MNRASPVEQASSPAQQRNFKIPHSEEARRLLYERAAILKGIRAFFDAQGFLEVETPVRIPAPAPECHIDCPVVIDRPLANPVDAASRRVTYLRASPELQMKKLLAAGFDRIYEIGPCFREGEKGSRHNPEFTMIEWYRRHATYRDIKNDMENLMAKLWGGGALAPATRGKASPDSGLGCCRGCGDEGVPAPKFRELTVRDAYVQFAHWDPWTAWDQDRFDFDMATVIEPKLKELGGGIFLIDYPVQAASLAKISNRSDGDVASPGCGAVASPVAERWEFYWNGMELANCFTELCDEDEQRRRFAQSKEERKALGEADYPLDEDFFRALPQIGSAAGVALGVDRLVMVLTGAKDIASVRVAP